MNRRRGNTAPSIMKVPLMALSKNVFSWKSPRLPGRQPRGFIFKIFRFRADSHRTSARLCLFRQSQTGDSPGASLLKESSSQFNGVHRKNGLPVRTLQRYAFNLKLPRFSTPKFAADMLQERYKRFFSPSQRRYSDVRGTTRFRKSVESDVERNAVNGITRS